MSASFSDAERYIQMLYEVTSLRAGSLEMRLDAALETITRALGLQVGILSRIVGDEYVVERVYAPTCSIQPGDRAPLSSTYSSLTIQAGGVLSINQIGSSPHAQHPLYLDFGYEAYLSAVVHVGGALYGTLSFAGAVRTTPFVAKDEELVVLLTRWIGVILDAQAAELQRREDEARFKSAFHDAAIGMAVVSPSGRLLDVNKSFCTMLGYPMPKLLELSFQQLTHPDDLTVDLTHFERVLAGKQNTYQLEKRFLHQAGHEVWGHLSVSAVRYGDGSVKYLIGQVQDINERKHYEAQVERLAYYDDLTGINNRRYFFEHAPKHLALAQREAWPIAFVYLDLNGFKDVNDKLGHQVGDEVLRQVANHFRRVLRENDLLARVGGDEFVVLLLNVTEAEAKATATRLADSLKQPLSVSSSALITPTRLKVGVSVGVVTSSAATDMDELVRQADSAMYHAKSRKYEDLYAVEAVTLKRT